MEAAVGIIGGSGFYQMPGFEASDRVRPQTPFGPPSSDVVLGDVDGIGVAFLARHGDGHRLPPSEVPYRANVFALKILGVHTIVSVNAVGSLHLAIAPGHLALPNDLYDRTRGRPGSFFGRGLVAHVGLANPFCPGARAALYASRDSVQTTVHDGGTLVVIEGPRFSTRLESDLHRTWGFRMVGMTTMPEAALAREAEVCYASLSVVTDYDVWHESEDEVSTDAILATMRESVRQAQVLVRSAIPALASRTSCTCRRALSGAIATSREAWDPAVAEALEPLVGPYLHRMT